MFGELEAKAAVLQYLLKNEIIDCGSSTVISEMTIARKARVVDLAYIDGDRMVAIEIKSHKDTLARLAGQVEEYKKYFDKVVVAVAPKFTSTVLSSFDVAIAVWEVTPCGVKVVRRGRLNKAVDKVSYLELMSKKEMVLLAKSAGLQSDLPVFELKLLLQRNLDRISRRSMKHILVRGFERKFKFPSYRFMRKVCGESKVELSDVALLSVS